MIHWGEEDSLGVKGNDLSLFLACRNLILPSIHPFIIRRFRGLWTRSLDIILRLEIIVSSETQKERREGMLCPNPCPGSWRSLQLLFLLLFCFSISGVKFAAATDSSVTFTWSGGCSEDGDQAFPGSWLREVSSLSLPFHSIPL